MRKLFALALLFPSIALAQVYGYFPPPGTGYNLTGGDNGGPLLTLGDTLNINSPGVPAHNPAVDLSSSSGFLMQTDAGTLLQFTDSQFKADWSLSSGTKVKYNVTTNGDDTYQGALSGIDITRHVINIAGTANSYSDFRAATDNNLTNPGGPTCVVISEYPIGATRPPTGVGGVGSDASIVFPAGYFGCSDGFTAGGADTAYPVVFTVPGGSAVSPSKQLWMGDTGINWVFTGGKTAFAVGDTNGFAYIEGPAGIPTGVPANIYTGRTPLRYDTTDNRLYAYNGSWQNVADHPTSPVLTATSASIGGGALAAGACSSTATTVTGATVGMGASATPNTYPGDPAFWKAYVSGANTVTTLICESIAATPTASTYNLRVQP